MPELPEVESVRKVMRGALKGHRIEKVEVADDAIVVQGKPREIEKYLQGAKVLEVGRKGKYWWLELDEHPWLFGHLGMSGWIRELDSPGVRLHSHGDKPLDEDGKPRFLKMLIETDKGRRIAFTDGRRLGRIWLGDNPETDSRIKRLGFDTLEELPTSEKLYDLVHKRKAPIKALLLDQGAFAGVGNWVADEVLFHARLDPRRGASTLTAKEVGALRKAIHDVLTKAVAVDADFEKFPDTWLFPHRWGGKRGAKKVMGHEIVRETVGGRTTAWVPDLQK